MNARSVVAVVLIVIGGLIIAYSGFTFTTPGETVDFLGVRVQTRETHFVPPTVGVLALIAGVVMLLIRPRSRRGYGKPP